MITFTRQIFRNGMRMQNGLLLYTCGPFHKHTFLRSRQTGDYKDTEQRI